MSIYNPHDDDLQEIENDDTSHAPDCAQRMHTAAECTCGKAERESTPTPLAVLREFVQDIDATGGIDPEGDGLMADPDWLDLRLTYEKAKAAIRQADPLLAACKALIDDFDQTGCSEDIGTVSIYKIKALEKALL